MEGDEITDNLVKKRTWDITFRAQTYLLEKLIREVVQRKYKSWETFQ